jgi:hypothetical protein
MPQIIVHVVGTDWPTIVASGASAIVGALVGGGFVRSQTAKLVAEAATDREHARDLARQQATAAATGRLLEALLLCEQALVDGLVRADQPSPDEPDDWTRGEFAIQASSKLNASIVAVAPMFANDDLRAMLSSAANFAANTGVFIVTQRPPRERIVRTWQDAIAYFRWLRWWVGRFAEGAPLPPREDAPDPSRDDASPWVSPGQTPPMWA